MFKSLILGLACLGLVSCQPAPSAPDHSSEVTPDSFESAYFTVTTSGAGPDVILVPGLASSGKVWDGTVDALSAKYTLHVIQVSGFGGEPARGNEANTDILDDLSRDLTRYAGSLPEPPAMVGHSLGGLVTMKTALDADAELRQIVVVDVLPFFSVLMDESATASSMQALAAVMKATLLAQSDAVFAASQAEALASLVQSEPDREMALEWSLQSDRGVMAQAMSEVLVTDLRAEIGRIDVPATVIFARDESIPDLDSIEAYYAELYAPLANGTVMSIDEALHFIMLDQPEAFHAALDAALVP